MESGIVVEALVRQLAWLLLGAALVGMLARWLRLPYAVALVAGGLLVAESHAVALPSLEPGVVLFVFLPPLLFDAAFRLDAREFRAVLAPVLVLAVPGVLVTAIIVGLLLLVLARVPLGVALLFGAIVAATDPVAVIGIFQRLHAPKRLATIAEGESLINDGMAITLYVALVGVAVTGTADPLGIVLLFGREVVGGVLLGAASGFVFSRLTGTIDDHLVEMTLSTALAYGSYLAAQALHASGPLACVTAGFIHGSYGRHIGMSENTWQRLDDLWEYLGFLANGVLFLLVGFSVSLASLGAQGWPVPVAILAVLAARVLVIAGSGVALSRSSVGLDPAERTVLIWAGLRGALTITLALALPVNTPARDLLIAMAFGVVLFTLLVQGLTLPLLLKRLGLAR